MIVEKLTTSVESCFKLFIRFENCLSGMANDKIKQLIRKGEETDKVEFKKKVSSSIAKEIVAFANADGGTVLVGITDDGEVVGVDNVNETKSRIQDIVRNCEPSVQINSELLEEENVIVIRIPESNEFHKAPKGFYKRQGGNSQKLTQEEIKNAMIERGRDNWDTLPLEEFRVD